MSINHTLVALGSLAAGIWLGWAHGPVGFLIGYALAAAFGHHVLRVHHIDVHKHTGLLLLLLLAAIPGGHRAARRGARWAAKRR